MVGGRGLEPLDSQLPCFKVGRVTAAWRESHPYSPPDLNRDYQAFKTRASTVGLGEQLVPRVRFERTLNRF